MANARVPAVITPVECNVPGIYYVPGQNLGRYPNSNSVLITTHDNPKEGVILDAGVGRRTLLKILPGFKITQVLLSHWHEDHSYGCAMLGRKGASFACHPRDTPVLKDVSLLHKMYFTADTPLEKLFKVILESLGIENLQSVDALSVNQPMPLRPDLSLRVLHAPGHSAGHCCFFMPEARVLFLGDIELSSLGPWYGAADSSVDDFEASIQKMLAVGAEFAITSHKGLIAGKSEIITQLQQFLTHIGERDRQILAGLSNTTPHAAEDLVGRQIIYKKYNPEWKDYLVIAERHMIGLHLSRLEKRGKVRKEGSGYVTL